MPVAVTKKEIVAPGTSHFFFAWNNICNRRRLDANRIRQYLERNEQMIVAKPEEADCILLISARWRRDFVLQSHAKADSLHVIPKETPF